jgi:hypothetical protein
MKKGIATYVIAAAAVIATGCSSGPKYPALVKTVDSLRGELLKTDSLLKTVDKEEAEMYAKNIVARNDSAVAFINMLADTITRADAEKLTNYRSLRKVFATYADNYDRYRNASDTLTMNLNNLAHDLQNNSLAEGLDPAKSVEHEKEVTAELVNEISYLVPLVKRSMLTHDSLYPGIKSYLNEMAAKVAARNSTKK